MMKIIGTIIGIVFASLVYGQAEGSIDDSKQRINTEFCKSSAKSGLN